MTWLRVVARFVARDEVEPARIRAAGIVRIDGFESFCGRSSKLDEFVTYGAVAAEDAAMGAAPDVEGRLRAEVRAIGNRRRARNGLVDALAVAAALFIAAAGAARLRRAADTVSPTVVAREVTTAFIPLPYSSVPASNAAIVRLELPRSALTSFGLVPQDTLYPADATVTADVIVGDDGLARAVRFVRAARKESR